MTELNVLLVGESWVSLRFDLKGFDVFPHSSYHEAIAPLRGALDASGISSDYLPTGQANSEFPFSVEEITAYDVIVLSDIGYNTLSLPPRTFQEFERLPDRLQLIEEFVRAGGGLLMIGGYLSFTGFNGKANYKGTPIETALPVTLQFADDRIERSDGVVPVRRDIGHRAVEDLPTEWPPLLGYNRVETDEDADVLVTVDDDPLLVVGEHGQGRSAAFTSDCAPHWGTPEFTTWDHYDELWATLIGWLGNS